MNPRSGQILPMSIVMIFLLSCMWIMLINAGKLIKDRVQMQIAADTAVQSACAVRARALNGVGLLNSWLGIPGLTLGAPHMAWWPVPPHKMGAGVMTQKIVDTVEGVKALQKLIVGGMKESDGVSKLLRGALQFLTGTLGIAYDTHPPEKPDYAEMQMQFVNLVMNVQTAYVKTYGGGLAYQKAREIARAQGADDIFVPPGSFRLGLQRNHGPIWYLSTLHIWFKGMMLLPVPSVPSDDHVKDSPDTVRWYEVGPHFYQKSMRLYAFRRPGSKRNGPFPLGRSVWPMTMPYLYTVAAARVYNPSGPMFPEHHVLDSILKDEFIGVEAFAAWFKARKGWRSQLVPVGGLLYDH